MSDAKNKRKKAVGAAKRELILDAARRVFETQGLEGASLRAVAAEAGYTPAALYFHFESKEALYAALLGASIEELIDATAAAADAADDPADALNAAAMAYFDFYHQRPRDLDLGFYLFRGGMAPKGVGRERDLELNAALWRALQPIEAAARALGADEAEAKNLTAESFAHANGLLLLAHTGRWKMFAAAPRDLMARYVDQTLARLRSAAPPAD